MNLRLEVFDRASQGRGAFDDGRVTEFKVIGMPYDAARRKRVGPLFYWAWATGEPGAVIGLHPHQGFEIFSYVLEGTLIHRDTLGSNRPVAGGGFQLMQTGSGVSHEEVMGESRTEFFQIWVEPHLREAVTRPPTYRDFAADAFPVTDDPGVRKIHLLGHGSPATLEVDAVMTDAYVEAGATLIHRLDSGRGCAALQIEGSGQWSAEQAAAAEVALGDLAVAENPSPGPTDLRFVCREAPARIAFVDVPLAVPYPLYPDG